MNKPVIQEETTGFRITSVAYILGKTYFEMKIIANSMGIHATDESLWSDTQYVRRMSSSAGVDSSDNETAFKSWEVILVCTPLSSKHHHGDGKTFWHWVVFKRMNGEASVLDSASYLPFK